ncbi:hypothetical protein BN6_37640 [Saccharothrix espanaensis DSM 44229]|uniref:Uncharacterized protein n=1 Tax=Saccharothrix espanaensis (strain ATCC 51144 / DSM 44229 / JCM 9112 / NBRC 15066 / NRRL 15764) TaxID=1179773 RepID=K0JTE2_SACES|nr:hypothetical protein BN6_37640 [Saccharothrix espanaensis DSM 44229]
MIADMVERRRRAELFARDTRFDGPTTGDERAVLLGVPAGQRATLEVKWARRWRLRRRGSRSGAGRRGVHPRRPAPGPDGPRFAAWRGVVAVGL